MQRRPPNALSRISIGRLAAASQCMASYFISTFVGTFVNEQLCQLMKLHRGDVIMGNDSEAAALTTCRDISGCRPVCIVCLTLYKRSVCRHYQMT